MAPHTDDRLLDYLGPGALSSLFFALLTAGLGFGLPVVGRLRQVLAQAGRDERRPADAVLVLGRTLEGDRPTPVFEARLAHGHELYRLGLAPRLVVAGGLTGRSTRTEAAAGKSWLLRRGVPAEHVHCEDRSRHTLENLVNVREAARRHGWERFLLVSDSLHLARAAAYARGLSLRVACSPAANAVPSGIWYWHRAIREAFFLHWYHVGVAYSRIIRSERLLSRVT